MIQVIFDKGNGLSHHVGGDYDSVEDAELYAIKAVEMSPKILGATITENGEIVSEVK